MKRVLLMATAALVVLVAVVVVRTVRFESRQMPAQPLSASPMDVEQIALHLSQAIRFQTVSYADPQQFPAAEFLGLHHYLEQAFPEVHRRLAKETVGEYSLLYEWPGQEATMPTVLLMAHQDVVPVEPGTESDWSYPPFGGQIADGYIWGRGAMDDKLPLIAIMEAVELLLREGFQPRRTVRLAFGHDEETGGGKGAAEIAALLKSAGTELGLVVDEGGSITDGMIQGLGAPAALVGIAEKGYASVELRAKAAGGHSSMPPQQTAIGILSTAIAKLEQHPMRARVEGATRQMFEYLGPEMPWPARMVMANQWLFGPLLVRHLAGQPATNAQIRTTTAATMMSGGVKENVLPAEARAVVNFRIAPWESVAAVLDHVKTTVNDSRIEARIYGGITVEPSPMSSTESNGYQLLAKTIREVYPGTLVAPYLVLGATDARYFAGMSGEVYRFTPMRMKTEDAARLHGTNERVSLDDLAAAVRFYVRLIRAAG
jgi:carboxypeptidase PM20D1